MIHTIDASGKSMGRVASEAAKFLLGKNRADFSRNKAADVTVVIDNASKLSISEKKKRMKKYSSYSGYQGGLKQERLGDLMTRRGIKIALTHAVKGMLPSNKLRPLRLKRLTIKN